MSCPKSRKGFSAARAIEKRSWQTTSKFIIKAKRAALNVMSDPTGLHRLGTTNMQRCFDRFRNHFEEAVKLDNQMLCDVDENEGNEMPSHQNFKVTGPIQSSRTCMKVI